jgi:hypothetical protein
MALTIVIITVIFAACVVYAFKAKANFPSFTDEQLLTQHRRFLGEMESSRKYIGATYFHAVEKGSPAQAELVLRGYHVAKLLQERITAEREDRPINWASCRAIPGEKPRKAAP